MAPACLQGAGGAAIVAGCLWPPNGGHWLDGDTKDNVSARGDATICATSPVGGWLQLGTWWHHSGTSRRGGHSLAFLGASVAEGSVIVFVR